MAIRSAPLRTPTIAGALRGEDVVDFARKAGADPVDVDVVLAAATTGFARHGLGRRYVGGIVIGTTVAHASNIAVATPAVAATAGYDPAIYVYVLANGAYTGTVRVRML